MGRRHRHRCAGGGRTGHHLGLLQARHPRLLLLAWRPLAPQHQKQGDRIQNVWANPITFDNRGQPNKPIEDQNFANGDGVLFYPGEEKLHPAEDRGIAGPCSTIQLANFRRGLQDHQYLTLARKAGLDPLVHESLEKVVPKMFSDAGETVASPRTATTTNRRAIDWARRWKAPRRNERKEIAGEQSQHRRIQP